MPHLSRRRSDRVTRPAPVVTAEELEHHANLYHKGILAIQPLIQNARSRQQRNRLRILQQDLIRSEQEKIRAAEEKNKGK